MGVNTLCQFDENDGIAAHATGKDCVGIVLEAATSSTEPLVQILTGESVIEAIGVGVTITAALVGNHVDIATGNELSLTDTNKDAIVYGWDGATATRALLKVKRCAFDSGAAAE
jgi:hypothetical protein